MGACRDRAPIFHRMLIKISTDGSADNLNTRTGGWAAIFRTCTKAKVIYGYSNNTTNNRMELTAAIEALKYLKHGNSELVIHSDSEYVVKGITQWISNWKKKNYKGVLNPDLWQELDKECSRHKQVSWQWVRGHADHKDNLLCDEFANYARLQMKAGEKLLEGE